MFNKTEMLQMKWGRNDRWQSHTGGGFTFPPKQGKPVKGRNLISKANRKVALEAARLLLS